MIFLSSVSGTGSISVIRCKEESSHTFWAMRLVFLSQPHLNKYHSLLTYCDRNRFSSSNIVFAETQDGRRIQNIIHVFLLL
jgi:hypothetical protein